MKSIKVYLNYFDIILKDICSWYKTKIVRNCKLRTDLITVTVGFSSKILEDWIKCPKFA